MRLTPFLLPLVFVPIAALAADPPRKPETAKEFEARFNQADTDKSGGLSKKEAESAAAPGFPVIKKNFDAMDSNKDGQVTLAERDTTLKAAVQSYRTAQTKRAANERRALEDQFAKADANRDGALSKKEVDKAADPGFPIIKKNFDAMDSNKNGKVTMDERDGFLKAEAERQNLDRELKAHKVFEDLFARADTNKSGGLSKKEVDGAEAPGFPVIKDNFDAMDVNRDGQVTVKERDDFLKTKR